MDAQSLMCVESWNPVFLVFTEHAPKLLYYSHIPTAIVALFLSSFVFWKKRTIISGTLLSLSVLFSIWNFVDLIVWTGADSRIIMLFWSTLYLLQALILVCTWYFARVFLSDGTDVLFRQKIVVGALLLPLILLVSTSWNLTGFDLVNCEAHQGVLVKYFYFFQATMILWILSDFLKQYRKMSDRLQRNEFILFFAGVFLFLISFSWGNFVGSLTLQWGIEQYGLFGMPIFIGLLAFLIVRYQTFDVKLLGTQALVIAQFLLIGSMLFFAKSDTNRVLTILTVLLTTGAGWFLVKSVKKEIERKEELQMMSDRLALANQELKRLDNAKSEFISIASHQLRTPLTAIKGYTSLILEGSYGKIDNQLQDVVNKVYTANSRLIELVENLLSISRLESGRMQYNYQSVQLTDIVNDAVGMFAVIAKKKGIDLQVLAPETPLPLLSLDAGKIREVVSNLIDNALKYTESGSVTVKMEQMEDGKVRLSVKDTGIGIKKEDLEHIFLKFARSKETEKLYVGGTGLGLYVGRTFIEKHGGRLWAESDGHGHGSEFIFELPISGEGV